MNDLAAVEPTDDEVREYRLDAADPEMARLNRQEWEAHRRVVPMTTPTGEPRTEAYVPVVCPSCGSHRITPCSSCGKHPAGGEHAFRAELRSVS